MTLSSLNRISIGLFLLTLCLILFTVLITAGFVYSSPKRKQTLVVVSRLNCWRVGGKLYCPVDEELSKSKNQTYGMAYMSLSTNYRQPLPKERPALLVKDLPGHERWIVVSGKVMDRKGGKQIGWYSSQDGDVGVELGALYFPGDTCPLGDPEHWQRISSQDERFSQLAWSLVQTFIPQGLSVDPETSKFTLLFTNPSSSASFLLRTRDQRPELVLLPPPSQTPTTATKSTLESHNECMNLSCDVPKAVMKLLGVLNDDDKETLKKFRLSNDHLQTILVPKMMSMLERIKHGWSVLFAQSKAFFPERYVIRYAPWTLPPRKIASYQQWENLGILTLGSSQHSPWLTEMIILHELVHSAFGPEIDHHSRFHQLADQVGIPKELQN
jgi:hypothetical protein